MEKFYNFDELPEEIRESAARFIIQCADPGNRLENRPMRLDVSIILSRRALSNETNKFQYLIRHHMIAYL